jgi:hypothetical protein
MSRCVRTSGLLSLHAGIFSTTLPVMHAQLFCVSDQHLGKNIIIFSTDGILTLLKRNLLKEVFKNRDPTFKKITIYFATFNHSMLFICRITQTHKCLLWGKCTIICC